jgi:hypothetical protein
MPATAARIAYVTEAARSVVWTDTGVKTSYGKAARDTLAQPIETFFDDVADAQVIADERGAILGAHARRFTVTTTGLLDFITALPLTPTLPGVHLDDTEKVVDMDCVITGVTSLDYETEKSAVPLWGVY